jgi:hypothetical protein
MAKLRSNYDGARYWAESILEDAPRAYESVNSIIVRSDTVYSFGSHYPMGKIFRREDGSVRRVVVTSSYFPVRGWANTPGDQDNVHSLAAEFCAKAKIELESKPLSEHGVPPLRCIPKAGDPEPPAHSYTDIVPFFTAQNPGPEPVRTTEGCVAGTWEEYSYSEREFVFLDHTLTSRVLPGDHPIGLTGHDRRTLKVRRWYNGFIFRGAHQYGERGWPRERLDGLEEWRAEHPNVKLHYVQCKHCADFDMRHANWRRLYNGDGWGRFGGRGWKLYREMMDTFGSEEAWREARLADYRRVRATRAERKAWEERNFIPYHQVDTDADGIIVLDPNGYVLRKNSERIFAAQRRREREAARLQRHREEQERVRRQAQRALARRERNILKHSPYQRFMRTARTTADEVRDILERESGHDD